ncbi:glycoside hydrolase family 88 protein [Demequina zhanjiangensis]|uniref:Glycoside hydrolase family 88 protein n=1 Tax=Demequina zhanjiangensis TaxID=3051659 RepID=A0ABT8G1T3_9MICO|nr:glycoside hydrolase family 88 protein [Demequina sp. SYSU T00b26]MDN4473098.1 glycoside hydrolase family 88 protein [Demequina sp. SYSU T00b26]
MTSAASVDREAIWTALLAMQRAAWEQGVASHAALDTGRVDRALAIARDAVARQDADGQLGGTGDGGLVNSGALYEAARLLGETDPAASEAAERQRWWLLRWSPRDDWGVLHHLRGSEEVWADSVYMVVPALVAAGDLPPADMQYRMHKEQLWNGGSGLWSHRLDMATGTLTRPEPWASGNGWVAAGLSRALHHGVAAQEVRERWQRDLRALLDACAVHVTEEGLFHDILDNASTFTDGCAGLMLAYSAFTGVADGWLDDGYAISAERWLSAALAQVDGHGLVHGVCGAPGFDSRGTSPEAQAFALMALAAHDRLS